MAYLTIREETNYKFEEKKSIFIGNIKRVYSEEEAKNFLEKIKNENKNARHNVYGYVIGENFGIQRYSDDGEPQGTGGIPILSVIKNNNITDVIIVVTRYFGGILLGTGGLTRAYSTAASMVIKEGIIAEKVKGKLLSIEISYDMLGKLQYFFSQNNWYIENIEYAEDVKIQYFCESIKIKNVKDKIIQLTSSKCSFKEEDEKYYFKFEDRLFEE